MADYKVMVGNQEVELPVAPAGTDPKVVKEKTMEQATVEFMEAATSRMKLNPTQLIPEMTKALLGQPTLPAPAAPPQPPEQPLTKEIAQMITSMTQMYQSIATTEHEARMAAETAKDTVIAERWQEIAAQTAETRKRLEEAQTNPATGGKTPMDIYKEYRDLITEEIDKIPKPPAPLPAMPPGSSDADATYRTRRLELSYETFKNQQNQIIENQKQQYELEKYKYDKDYAAKMADIAERKARQDALINTLTGFLDNLGKNPSVQGFLGGLGKKGNSEAPAASPNVADITATITSFPCQSCGTPIGIEPEATAVACSKCGTVYEITKQKKG